MPQPSEHEPVFASADLPAEAARAWLTALFDAQAAAGDPEALTSGQRADLRELLGSTWWRSLFRGETAVEDPEAILIRALPPAVRAASGASEGAVVLALYLRNLINEGAGEGRLEAAGLHRSLKESAREAVRMRRTTPTEVLPLFQGEPARDLSHAGVAGGIDPAAITPTRAPSTRLSAPQRARATCPSGNAPSTSARKRPIRQPPGWARRRALNQGWARRRAPQ